jgi:hypothetical protein
MTTAVGKLWGTLPSGITWEYEGSLTSSSVKHGKGVEKHSDGAVYSGE